MGLRTQQWQQIVRSFKPVYLWKQWWTGEYPYQWMSQAQPGTTPADQDSLDDGVRLTPQTSKDGSDGTERPDTPEQTDGFRSTEAYLVGVGVASPSVEARSSCRCSDRLRQQAKNDPTYPNLLPGGSLTMEQSLRHWTVTWSLSLMKPVDVQNVLAHYAVLLDPRPEETTFLSVLNQMIEEQRKQSDFPDDAELTWPESIDGVDPLGAD